MIIEDGDPTSPTFKSILNLCLRAATDMPTSGFYLAGAIVLDSSAAGTRRGWRRLTIGSGHVLNTDWVEI